MLPRSLGSALHRASRERVEGGTRDASHNLTRSKQSKKGYAIALNSAS